MPFPENNETADCPTCGGKCCAFGIPNQCACLTWEHTRRDDSLAWSDSHYLDVRRCLACGHPLIRHRWKDGSNRLPGETPIGPSPSLERIYPALPTRSRAPDAVREANEELAQDYDEAVACEPISLQASAMLLGRCASIILIDSCDADPESMLGGQFASARTAGKLSGELVEQYCGLIDHRNRSAHPWFEPSGKTLKVTQDDLDWCFVILGLMFDYYYVNPARLGRWTKRLKELKDSRSTSA